jgi:hypothetical protein
LLFASLFVADASAGNAATAAPGDVRNDPGSGVVDHPSSRRSSNSGAFANEVVRQRQRAWQQRTTIGVQRDPVC